MSTPQCQIIAADKIPGSGPPSDDIHPWFWSADEAYLTALFHLFDAQSTLAERFQDRSSLYHHRAITFAIVDDRPLGGFISWPGRHAVRQRESDLLDLFARTPEHARQRQRAILGELISLQGPLDRHDAYLAALGVAPSVPNATAIYRLLIDAAIDAAESAGHEYLRIDLDTDHPALDLLYKTFDFQVFDQRHSTPLALDRLHLNRRLSQ